jgi:hemoglobin
MGGGDVDPMSAVHRLLAVASRRGRRWSHRPYVVAVYKVPDIKDAVASQRIPAEVCEMAEQSLYDRLGGVFAIAAVVDDFSDAIIKNARVGELSDNPQLREWSTKQIGRLPGLKFMRTLWVCNVAGGPFEYSPTVPGHDVLGLEEAHRRLRITPEEFDEVASELSQSLDRFNVPEREKGEVLAAFAAHKGEVTEGSRVA